MVSDRLGSGLLCVAKKTVKGKVPRLRRGRDPTRQVLGAPVEILFPPRPKGGQQEGGYCRRKRDRGPSGRFLAAGDGRTWSLTVRSR